MKLIFTVFKKELLVTIRDKRTLITSVFLPALLIPVLIVGIGKFQKSLIDKENAKKINIALIGGNQQIKNLLSDSTINWIDISNITLGRNKIKEDKLDAIIEIEKTYFKNLETLKTGIISLHYKSTNLSIKARLREKMELIKTNAIKERIQFLKVEEEALVPVKIQELDIATTKEQIGLIIGGFIPYIFIIFSFMGCMYPAIDLITGEREKKTLETLLTVPVSHFKILMGKVITIALFGLISAIMAILGIVVMINFSNMISNNFLQTFQEIINFKFIIMLLLMLMPLTFFFAGILTLLVSQAKSFKEAQSIVTPMTFVIIIPAMIALMPGMSLSWETAFIPILNVALATKQIISGAIQLPMYIAIVLSLILIAIIAIYISHHQFSKEKMILN